MEVYSMSWDKYNEARKKAKAAKNKVDSASKVVDKLTGKSDSKITKSDVNQAKTAVKNAKKYGWLLSIWVVITILALVSLIFTNTIEPAVNNWIYGPSNTTGTTEDDGDVVTTIADVNANSALKVHYVFVGQGDCIMIDLPDGKNVIIDSGSETYNSETSQKVLSYIDTYLLDDGEIIDYMILTHPDSDHMYYLPDILDTYEVATIYRPYTFFVSDGEDSKLALDPDGTIATVEEQAAVEAKERAAVAELNSEYGYGIKIGEPKNTTNAKSTDIMYKFISRIYNETHGPDDTPAEIYYPIAGEHFGGDEYTFTFYAPITPSNVYSSWNNYSSVIVLDYNGTKIAFTGDAETEEEDEILANESNLPLPDVDIMDMGHHGSDTSSQDAFVKALSPEYAIISCGINNKYGHPKQKTIDTLYNNGVDSNHIFITAQSGDIVIGFGYTGNSSASGDNEEVVDNNAGQNQDSEVTSTTADNQTVTRDFVIAYTGEASLVAPSDPDGNIIKWWYVVVGIIVISGVILLIIIPSFLKSSKKSK